MARGKADPRESIRVETDLFEHRRVQPDLAKTYCPGEDFATWLTQEWARYGGMGWTLSSPIQEDVRWGFWATRGKHRFWVALSYVGGGFERALWIITAEPDPGLDLTTQVLHRADKQVLAGLRKDIRKVLGGNEAIKVIEA